MSEYRPSPRDWVREHVAAIEEAGTTRAARVMDRDVVLVTMTGRRSGATLKVPLMRVEHGGVYAAVASKGGAPEHPQWYYNLQANPDVTVQDDTTTPMRARQISGDERDRWWERCVAAYPLYADYQKRTDRLIPVFLLETR